MDARFANPIVNAICDTFATMCSIHVEVGTPSPEKQDVSPDVSSIVTFTGDVDGKIALHFPIETAAAFASAFAGTRLDADHPDFLDVIGELANFVAGSASSRMDNTRVLISLPVVITGHNHHTHAIRAGDYACMPCRSEAGNFTVEMWIRRQKKTADSAPNDANVASTV